MAERTFGWIQNPSSFMHLKTTISIFDETSKIYKDLCNHKLDRLVEDVELLVEMKKALKSNPIKIPYVLLKGKGTTNGVSRKLAKCTGIVQAVIENQSGREYTDDWTADGFIRWAISIGLLGYDDDRDEVFITNLGLEFVRAKEEAEETEILIRAFLSYPPATRVLTLLEKGDVLTKFEIGHNLGGLGEAGFTSIPQDLYIQALATSDAKNVGYIRSNTEGSADKYARMISGWLCKVDLLQRVPKEVEVVIGNKIYKTTVGHSYKITLQGIKALNRIRGKSSLKRIPKIVYWQMLATKGMDRDYIRNRRAMIIGAIYHKHKTLDEIEQDLVAKNMDEDSTTIKDELGVIHAMGIAVKEDRGKYVIEDEITNLKIPQTKVTKTNMLDLKDRIRRRLHRVNHRYLALVDLAYDSKSNRDFEIQTIDLLINELGFKGMRLGESRKPDGIISYKDKGVIIDNKAYSKGYNLPISQADEMIRYIEENQKRDEKLNKNKWWENFDEDVKEFNFLFISSTFIGGFQNNIQYIADRTQTRGAAIDVENLLYLAEELKSSRMEYENIGNVFCNDEIVIP